MSKPIYNFFVSRGTTDRWIALPEAEKESKYAKLGEAFTAAGGERVVMCQAGWWNTRYRWWGVEKFPDFAAWRQFTAAKEEIGWPSYSNAWSMLGTWHPAVDPAEAAAAEPGKVYQAFLLRGFTEAYEQLSQAEKEALWAKEAESRQGAKPIVMANSYWSSEEYLGFGVTMFSDIDAVQNHFAALEQINWSRYVHAVTFLGTPWGE